MRKHWLWLPILLLLGACGTLKRLPAGEKLYRGAELRWEGEGTAIAKKELTAALEEVLYPATNTRVLGSYPALWLYQRAQSDKKRWLAKEFAPRFGEKPVLVSEVKAQQLAALLKNRLENEGFLRHSLRFEWEMHERTGKLVFYIAPGEPYRLAQYSWWGTPDSLARLLMPQLAASGLKAGSRYSLSAMEAERERLDVFLKNQGYYAFSPDYLLFKADTSVGNRQFKLYLSVKQATPAEALRSYRLQSVEVYPNMAFTDSARTGIDTQRTNELVFVDGSRSFKPERLAPFVLLRPGQLYNRSAELTTANRISSLGNFRYVTVRFDLPDSLPPGNGPVPMNARIDLAPSPRRRLRYETQFLSKSNNFVGPALKIGYQNRNLFRGGELLNVDLNGGFETQFAGGRQTGLNAFEVGLKGELIFPRIVSPVDLGGNIGYGLARSRLAAGISLLNRIQFYRLRSFQAAWGYQWQTNRFVTHDFQPASISFTGLSRTSTAFDDILAANPFLRQSFEQRFIAGLVYQGTFSELAENKPHRWVAIVGLDAAGNLPGLITGSDQLLGETLARYVRLDADIRYHRVFSDDRRLVLRIFGGYGYSYGASPTLPYIKQYFAGGPNSVRAFNIRSLGPGNYRPANFDLASFFDQAGDIKLEANVEYRFPLVPYLKGAVFADAGNIWLQRPNPALRGGHFTSQWAQELGVGAGFGLRIDADILVLRFDLATPLRKPWLPAGERWFDSFSLADRAWRRENLNLVFAIGYPF
ncbi:MAG: hypothetical protein C0424_04685 [Sphingobacteriaceae bacterium]|nr:hypothetical protein [Sphingobacteriaceae bacterium]